MLNEKDLKIERVTDILSAPIHLLLLADPAEERIKAYLKLGRCFVAKQHEQPVAVIVLVAIDLTRLEIKNIAVEPERQGQGIGKKMLQWAYAYAKQARFEKLVVGTGNSSIQQLRFYQQQGFEISSIRKNFFLSHYDEPIFENGIQCKHMIMLSQSLLCALKEYFTLENKLYTSNIDTVIFLLSTRGYCTCEVLKKNRY